MSESFSQASRFPIVRWFGPATDADFQMRSAVEMCGASQAPWKENRPVEPLRIECGFARCVAAGIESAMDLYLEGAKPLFGLNIYGSTVDVRATPGLCPV